jgi:hypothetical protein
MKFCVDLKCVAGSVLADTIGDNNSADKTNIFSIYF